MGSLWHVWSAVLKVWPQILSTVWDWLSVQVNTYLLWINSKIPVIRSKPHGQHLCVINYMMLNKRHPIGQWFPCSNLNTLKGLISLKFGLLILLVVILAALKKWSTFIHNWFCYAIKLANNWLFDGFCTITEAFTVRFLQILSAGTSCCSTDWFRKWPTLCIINDVMLLLSDIQFVEGFCAITLSFTVQLSSNLICRYILTNVGVNHPRLHLVASKSRSK